MLSVVAAGAIQIGNIEGSGNDSILKHNLQKSYTVVNFWKHKGRYALKLNRDACWEVRFPKQRDLCRYARHNLSRHKHRIQRLSLYFNPSPEDAIRRVFGRYADQALSVAWCESHMNIWATNGQYKNLFQMGLNEREDYGWHDAGSPAIVAARAAYRYFVASGYTWGPWECKP